MKRNSIFFASALLCASTSLAQGVAGDTGTFTPLLPEGVTGYASDRELDWAEENIAVAGSQEKGYKAYFVAGEDIHGKELWATDGTPEGTYLVKDIYPGPNSSNITWLTRFNDKVIFSASDDVNGQELWISDGTEDGTYMVADINQLDNSNPRGFQQLNETQFVFFAQDPDAQSLDQWWLYVSDGTEEGTRFVKAMRSLFPGRDAQSNRAGDAVRVGRRVFFIADVSDTEGTIYGDELWVTDGTEEGTYMVKDVNKEAEPDRTDGSTRGASIAHLTNYYNEKLFFKAWSWESGTEPWASDGTEEGTYEIFNTNPTVTADAVDANGVPRGNSGTVTRAGYPAMGYIFYRGSSPEAGNELAMTNLEKGNWKIFDINTTEPTNKNHSSSDPGVEFDGVYMFCCDRGKDKNIADPFQAGGELNACDGETAWLVNDFNPGVLSTWCREMTVCGGTLYYGNTGTKDGKKGTLVRIDKKDGVPMTISNIDASNDGIHMLRNLNGKLICHSRTTKQMYCYDYDNPDKNLALNPERMEIVFEPNNPLHDAAITTVAADVNNADAPVEYYNIQGQRTDASAPGIYIRRQGSKAEKIIVR